MTSLTPTISTCLTFGQRELRRPSLRDDVEQLEELVLFDSSRVDPKGRTYIDPDFTGINIIPNGPMLYIISQLKSRDLCNVAQVSHRFNKLTDQYRGYLYSKEDFDTLLKDIIGTRSEIWWLARCHPERKCSPVVLDWASRNGNTEIVRLLLAANKPCTINALDYASKHGHTEIVKLLLAANKPCSIHALNQASKHGHTEIVKLLLGAGTPYSDCTTYALNCASRNGYTEVVRLLLAANKPCNYNAIDYASENGHTEVVRLLSAANKPSMYKALDLLWNMVNRGR